jgi:hypothetical protein
LPNRLLADVPSIIPKIIYFLDALQNNEISNVSLNDLIPRKYVKAVNSGKHYGFTTINSLIVVGLRGISDGLVTKNLVDL